MIPLPKFLYTTPTPDTERNTPDFQKLSKNSFSNKTEDPNGTKTLVKIEDSNCSKTTVKKEDPNVSKASITNFVPCESNAVIACVATSTAKKKRKTGVVSALAMPVTKNNPSSEILIQVPDKKESIIFAGTKNVVVYETQSKLESDV